MPHLKFEWNPSPTTFRILDIWFINDIKGCAQLNFDIKFQEAKKKVYNMAKERNDPLG